MKVTIEDFTYKGKDYNQVRVSMPKVKEIWDISVISDLIKSLKAILESK